MTSISTPRNPILPSLVRRDLVQDGCWYGYSDRCSRSFSEAETMVAGERVARACGPGVLLQEPTDYVKVHPEGKGVALGAWWVLVITIF